MSEVAIVISLGLAFAVVLAWLVRPRRTSVGPASLPIDRTLESALPKHFRFFPQIRQALSAGDAQYLLEVAPPHIAKQVRSERRAVARRFLRGLHEDFSNLERLARMIASLSPVISREQETERLMLGLRFRVLYALVCLRLYTGVVPLQEIEHLTELVGRLTLRMQQAMAEISALSAERVPRGLNA